MGAIKCFGDFWSRKDVDWDPAKHSGHRELLGYRRRPKLQQVDFRWQIGVYVLFTRDREVIYVGQVGGGPNERANLYGRLRRHTYNRLRNRWEYFSWFGIREVNADTAELLPYAAHEAERVGSVLDELEGILIHLLEPKLNRQGARWGGALEYLQVPLDSKAELSAKPDEDDETAPEI